MERNVYDILEERGFLKQCSHPEELRELLGREKVTFYIGFDPTADSLHIGHYVALMTMAHMQRAGHRPIVLLGGGTAMIGDPSGKTDMRRMMSNEEIDHNASCFQKQMARLIDFSDGKALVYNNADWIRNLNFLDFMRDIGVHFSVNSMLRCECYKQRMERGLTFFEMSYMLMQSYDFLMLNRKTGCILEMGGDDQWSNILGGADLIRRKEQKPAYALTTTLLTTSEGKKMGKTEKGALWLDPNRCSPYEFYQYWRNIDDADVERCLALLTFLPMDEVKRLGSLKDSAINEAKRVLAYTLTEQVHGTDEANKARSAAEALFSGGKDFSHMPSVALTEQQIAESGLRLPDLLVLANLAKSKSDARRLIADGAVFAGERKVESYQETLQPDALEGDGIILRKGKKSFCRMKRA
ncbi:MAG: tyrosine--tRNA ligase [Candidatus Aphodomorpha sp.]